MLVFSLLFDMCNFGCTGILSALEAALLSVDSGIAAGFF